MSRKPQSITLYCNTSSSYNKFPKNKCNYDDWIFLHYYDAKLKRTIKFDPEFYTLSEVRRWNKDNGKRMISFYQEKGDKDGIKYVRKEVRHYKAIIKQLESGNFIALRDHDADSVSDKCPKRGEHVYVNCKWLTVPIMEKAIRLYLIQTKYIDEKTEIKFVWSFYPYHLTGGKLNYTNFVKHSWFGFYAASSSYDFSVKDAAKQLAKLLDSKKYDLTNSKNQGRRTEILDARQELLEKLYQLCQICGEEPPPPEKDVDEYRRRRLQKKYRNQVKVWRKHGISLPRFDASESDLRQFANQLKRRLPKDKKKLKKMRGDLRYEMQWFPSRLSADDSAPMKLNRKIKSFISKISEIALGEKP